MLVVAKKVSLSPCIALFCHQGPILTKSVHYNSIGFGESQLLNESTSKELDDIDAYDYGVALPPGFRVHSMSIIKDPADKLLSSRSKLSNRALLLLAQISNEELPACSIKYALYQLQVTFSNGKRELVLLRSVANGIIPLRIGSPDIPEAEAVTGIFLAGGSFLFNLDTDGNSSGKEKIRVYFEIRLV